MKFIKLLKFDLKNGLLRQYKIYAILFVTMICAFIDFSIRMMEIRAGGLYGDGTASLGTFLFYVFGGMEKYIPSPDNPFLFPALWLLVLIQVLFSTLYYPFNNLEGIGSVMLVFSGKRKYWWFSKCIWNLCSVLLCFMIIFISGILGSLICGNEISFSVGPYAQGLFQKVEWIANPKDMNILYYFSVAPFIVAVTISLFQMMLSLIIKPIFSFWVSIFLLVGSAYYVSPAMIGNYAMAVRADILSTVGVNAATGMAICIAAIIITVLFGNWLFGKYNILGKDNQN